MGPKRLYLFGGDKPWKADEWTASDDRVRGGKSQSYLDIKSSSIAKFNGTLDIKTLGGAGFASQRTKEEDESWNLSKYDGVELHISKADSKLYTFTIKDELLPQRSDGREQSSVSYEYDFNVDPDSASDDKPSTVFIAWSSLKPTYRGKPKDDAPKLNKKKIKRFSIMNRSFFGDQEGDFSLSIKSIAAVQNDLGYEELAASVNEKSGFLDVESGTTTDEKSPLTGFTRGPADTPDMVMHDRRRVRTAIARMIFYSAIVVILVHGVTVLRHGCATDASKIHW